MITRSSGYFSKVGMTSPPLIVVDLPEPEEPSTTPEPVFRSRFRSSVMILFDN